MTGQCEVFWFQVRTIVRSTLAFITYRDPNRCRVIELTSGGLGVQQRNAKLQWPKLKVLQFDPVSRIGRGVVWQRVDVYSIRWMPTLCFRHGTVLVRNLAQVYINKLLKIL